MANGDIRTHRCATLRQRGIDTNRPQQGTLSRHMGLKLNS